MLHIELDQPLIPPIEPFAWDFVSNRVQSMNKEFTGELPSSEIEQFERFERFEFPSIERFRTPLFEAKIGQKATLFKPFSPSKSEMQPTGKSAFSNRTKVL